MRVRDGSQLAWYVILIRRRLFTLLLPIYSYLSNSGDNAFFSPLPLKHEELRTRWTSTTPVAVVAPTMFQHCSYLPPIQ